ncbi:L-type lectin-like domain-containing protein [Elsinoe australis]|uniref:L-type lectin-like domain-containing protein n=1 Tax=Elsinoe australis TaxID=40998 RepID=A0A2P7ZDQ6_9PEZI|nr:L-type lectin-like domain-containing protein [Elsinoe australis]
MLRGFLNDGSTDYKNHHMVDSLAFGHCDFFYRNLGRSSKIKITHDQRGLEVKIDDQPCFSSNKVALPSGYVFGMTAATADNPDSFEVNKFTVIKTHDAPHPGHFDQPPAHNQPRNEQHQQHQQQHMPNAPEQIPDRDATSIKKQEEQFADLHNRLQGLSHQVNNIFNEFDRLARDLNTKHEQILSRSSQPRGSEEAIRTMSGRIENIEHIVHGLERDLASRDYGHHLHELHQAVTEGLPGSLHQVVKGSAPKITTFIFIVIAVQVMLLDVKTRKKLVIRGGVNSDRGRTHKLNAYVNPKSLDRTLKNHREANQSSRIKKIVAGTDPHALKPELEGWNVPHTQAIDLPVSKPSGQFQRSSKKFLSKAGLLKISDEDVEDQAKAPREIEHEGTGQSLSYFQDQKEESFTENFKIRTYHLPETGIQNRYREVVKSASAARSDKGTRSKNSVSPDDEGKRRERRRALLRAMGDNEFIEENDWIRKHEVFKRLRQHLRTKRFSNEKLKEIPWNIMEYNGGYVPLPDEGAHHDSSEPWKPRTWTQDIQQLGDEIDAFQQWVTPTVKERNARRMVSGLALAVARDTNPDLGAELFGTQITRLATPLSDIDIRLYDPALQVDNLKLNLPPNSKERADLLARLKAGIANIALSLSSHPDFTAINLLHLPFPLVQATHVPSSIVVQFVASPQTYHSRTFVQSSLATHPSLKPIYYLLKTALSRRDLLSPYHGHLSSYALFNLLVAVLLARQTMYTALTSPLPVPKDHLAPAFYYSQTVDPSSFFPSLSASPSSSPPTDPSPAYLLLDTLHLLTHINTYRYGISARTGLLFPKRNIPPKHLVELAQHDKWTRGVNEMARFVPWQNYLLCLQDGADEGNDLGRKAVGWKTVQRTLSDLWEGLRGELGMEVDQHGGMREVESQRDRGEIEDRGKPTGYRDVYGAKSWSLNDGVNPDVGKERRNEVPLLRRIVGRPDIEYEAARTRLELFADGNFGWRESGARKEESEEVREARRVEFLDMLHVRKRDRKGCRRTGWEGGEGGGEGQGGAGWYV